jgi:hypothetical protein
MLARMTDTHLVTVWNPAYADAMEATLELLVSRARAARDKKLDDADVFAWWGKVKSSNRQQRMPHLADVLALDARLQADDAGEVHLYITDYRSLFVGHVGEITADDVRADDDGGVPAFYSDDMQCDCWFRLLDVRRLITDDTVGVVEELKKLANTRYNDRPVSIYGGMVDLPLIVTRADGVRYFDEARDALTDGLLWVEFDAQRTGAGRMERELRDNLLGDGAWSGLEPTARGFIASAESLFRSARADRSADMSAVVVDFAKAFESQVNHVVRRVAAQMPERDRMANVDGASVDLACSRPLSLGQLAHVIAEERALNEALKAKLRNGQWFAAQLPPILKDLSETRNSAAHSSRVPAARVTELRNRLVGVGCPGVFVELGKVAPVGRPTSRRS